MKVILQRNVEKLGMVGDVVESKPGYYRNYLEPRGLAVQATSGTLKKRDEEIEALRAKSERLHLESVALGERITAVGSVNINQRAGDGGRLYGKVTNKDIAEAISQAIGTPIDKKGIKTLEQITAVGIYKVFLKISAEVQAEFSIVVYDETQGQPPTVKPAVAAAAPAESLPAEEVEAVESAAAI